MVLENHAQVGQFFCKRIPALCRLCSNFYCHRNGLGPLVGNRFNQPELVRSVCLGSLESGDEFGVGKGLIHRDLIV